MRSLTVTQLEEQLFGAARILRGRVESTAYAGIISAMLVLKWASDQPGTLRIPDRARWPRINDLAGRAQLGPALSEALQELEQSNPGVLDGVFENLDIPRRLGAAEVNALIRYFGHISLSDGDLEFTDVVGRAYDRFIGRFAEMAGKRGGEFFTPRSVVNLMVRLTRPEPGQSVYDPFTGSGGLLVQAREYVRDHGGDEADVALFGQELNYSTWAIARLNLLLHGATESSLLRGDILTDPLHMFVDGRRTLFDRALTHPPFSMSYARAEVRFPERMRYGWTPEHGKADLMYVQHVLAMLRPDGVGAVVAPLGVLFRGGAEAEIRRGIIEDNRLEAVISLGPNLFHGTSIPACILVLRGTEGPPEGRRGKVLFINAERELVKGHTQNRLEPEHVEKIVGVFRDWTEMPGFSRAVPVEEIAANGFNLNIRRFVDSGLPAEPPLDARAILAGGVPVREVEAEASRFQVFGIDLGHLFRPNATGYLDFPPGGFEAAATSIEDLATPREQAFARRCQSWWEATQPMVVELAGEKRLLKSRSLLIASFRAGLLPAELLDQYQLSGAFAAWWSYWQDDIRTLDLSGFSAVNDRWATISGSRTSRIPEDEARARVLDRLGADLCSRTQSLVTSQRQALAATYRAWGDRYATSLTRLEAQREATAVRLDTRLRDLGYIN
jgi:type I restriction enzyme M protein